MNATPNSTLSTGQSDLLTLQQYFLVIHSCMPVILVISLVGLLANLFNVIVFAKIGFKDTVNLSFFYLSVFDFFVEVFSLLHMCSTVVRLLDNQFNFSFFLDPFVISWLSASLKEVPLSMSTMTTIFLSVVRCMCVLRPLSFKNTFTPGRTHMMVLVFAIISSVVYLLAPARVGLTQTLNDKNQTRLVLQYSQAFFLSMDVRSTATIAIKFIAQGVVVLCVFILAHTLRAASAFRSQHSSAPDRAKSAESGAETGAVLSGKDLQAVKQVGTIAAIFVVCNTPTFCQYIVRLMVPGYSEGGQYRNTVFSMAWITFVFDAMNSAINTVVYLKYNTKFKEVAATLVNKL